MLPSKQQWAKWTLPSKYSFIGLLLGIVGIVIGLYSLTLEGQKSSHEQPYVAKRISRIEFLVQTIDRLLPDTELIEPVRDPYLDIQAQYKYAKYVVFAYKVGFINPPSQKSPRFDPEREISRGELSKILARVMCYARQADNKCFSSNVNKLHLYQDMSTSNHFSKYVSFLIRENILNGKGKFYQNHPISREDAFILIEKSAKNI